MLPFRIVDRIKFIVERQLVKGAGFQLLVVGGFIALISLIGGLLDVLKAVQKVIMPDAKDSQGMIFTVPLEHLGGIDMAQVEKFEQHLKDSL